MSLIVIFIILQNGLYLDNLSFSNITITNTYIKWNEKLNISIDKLDIANFKKSNSSNEEINFKEIQEYISYVSQFLLITDTLLVEKIHYKDITATLKHSYHDNGFFTAKSSKFSLNSHFKLYNSSIIYTLKELSTLQNQLHIHGNIILDPLKENIYSKLNISLHKDINLTLYTSADKMKLTYKIISNNDISHIHELMDLFNLPKELQFWANNAIDAQSLHIDTIKGFIKYKDMANAYKNIFITATLKKLNYTYNTKLDAIHTYKTDLEFKNGILYIRPREAYSYSMYLDKSWLKIDFTKKDELLTLYLLFNGKLNKDMLFILNTYGIKLPFLQHSGEVKTDLEISVKLRSIQVKAKGTFFTQKANFDYLGLNIDISDTLIQLNNYDVTIPKMKARYKKIAKADVKVKYNAKQEKGTIDFIFNKIVLNNKIFLDPKVKKLHASYKISPKGDTITAEKSSWRVDDMNMKLDSLSLPFNLKKLKIKIPTTYFKMQDIADGFITGEANIKDLTTQLKIDLLHFKYSGIKLAQSNLPLQLSYNKELVISSANPISLFLNGSPYKIEKLHLQSNFKTISLKKTKLYVSNYITTQIDANYIIDKKRADITLTNFILLNPKNTTILYYNNKIKLLLKLDEKKTIHIYAKELDANFTLENSQWVLNLKSIKTIAKNSKILQEYKIDNGKIRFYKNTNDKYTKFLATINYKYKLLTDLNHPVTKYTLKGYITKKQNIYCTVNRNLNLKIGNEIKINLNNSGINVDELLQFIEFVQKLNKNKTKQKTDILFNAKNSYLYMGYKRYVLSDTMHLQYYKGITTAQLKHANANAGFKLEGDEFHLYGQGFNDLFMDNLFALSKFKGGSLDFSLNGKLSDYQGTFFIKNTTMEDYVLLNNILAFINTVPSLATFSLPGYSKNGLHIDNAYMKFHFKKDIFNISDIYIGSKEITIAGTGTASIKYNNIDLLLNLKTDIGSSISKIPVVGYLIFDGKSLSTTLKISGELTNPSVKTMIAKDIAVAPLNIIQRTLTLPYKLFKNISDINSSKE